MKKHYLIRKVGNTPALNSGWNEKEWEQANILNIDIFLNQINNHHPETKAKLLYNKKGIYGQFKPLHDNAHL